MKKEFVILLVVLIVFGLFSAHKVNSQTTGSTVTGSTVTGEATSAGASLSITLRGLPTLILHKPKNETYITDKNLDLEFLARSADSIWYNINNTANITITGNTTFNSTVGSHILYLFANNTYGESSKEVIFSVDPSRFHIYYNNFTGPKSGDSTDFNKSSFEEIQNLSGIVLENTDFGKIIFNESINLTDDANPGDNILDIDSNVNISFNKIKINLTELPNFNKSATISLYNLTFSNPRILKDGEVCPASVCTILNYVGGILVFNVTQFGAYSAEETPEALLPEEKAKKRREIVPEEKDFELDIEQLYIKLKQGEISTRGITIKNNLDSQLNLNIFAVGLGDFVLIKDSQITLAPGESKEILLDFIARITEIPELYVGKIMVVSKEHEEEILVMIEIQSKEVLFDVYAEIDPKSKRIFPGEEILAQIRLFNLGKEEADVIIEYFIRDLENNIILRAHEAMTIETHVTLMRSFPISKDTETGNYIFYVRTIYNGEVASASDFFEVIPFSPTKKQILCIILAIIISIIISLIIYCIIKKRVKRKIKGRT